MWALFGLLAGALAGNALWDAWGAALGGLAGFLIGAMLTGRHQRALFRKPDNAGANVVRPGAGTEPELRARIAALEARVDLLERTQGAQAPRLPEAAEVALPATAATTPGVAEAASVEVAAGVAPEATPASAAAAPPPAAPPAPPPVNPVWAWFTEGNALARIGVVVLFFGVAFLLRYFAEHFTVPIELRLGGVALAGAALVGLGMRLAGARPGYGLSLQGAGAGILYLTTFAAFRLYDVLPEGYAIALLAAVAGTTVLLALRADSQPLAALALLGGFLAPLLVATRGAPLPLFAWFAVLNAAIFAIAWRRAWQALNVLGFVCTLALGLAWGHRYYAAEHFATVEPFLVLFLAFYVAIVVLEARRDALDATRPVAGILVFGAPLAAFALQVALVEDFEYGAAWSAGALAAVYALLHLALRRRQGAALALLAQAFLALAVIFATLAIPLALDDRWTAALWAVEAAGVYWIGVRQRSPWARAFALLVEIGAGVAFAGSAFASVEGVAFANARFIGAMAIALSGFATAFVADRAGETLPERERPLVPLLFGWGAIWWLLAGGLEAVRELDRATEPHGVLGWVVASVFAALLLRRMISWPRLAGVAVALLPVMAYVALRDFRYERTTLEVYGWAIWPAAWFAHWLALRAADPPEPGTAPAAGGWLRAVHAVSAFALTAQLAWEASEWLGRLTPAHTVWVACGAALPAIAFLAVVRECRDSARWPWTPHGDAYAVAAGAPIAALVALWFVAVNVLSPGDVAPLPYLPIGNVLDLTLAVALIVLLAWAKRFAPLTAAQRYAQLGVALFIALNGVVLRTAHQWGDIPWRLSALLASKPLQASLTLAWTLTAVALMYAATRRRLRPLWMVGAALLGVVVAKLFLVDLGALSGLPRVVAFLGVGVLLLGIGFLSPLPPAAEEDGDR